MECCGLAEEDRAKAYFKIGKSKLTEEIINMEKEAKTSKRKWQKPDLIVLTRSKPEEEVLTACKLAGGGMSGPSAGNCSKPAPGCSTLGPS